MRYGFGYVKEKGFMAFAHDLSEGAWKDVVVQEQPEQTLGPAPLDVPRDVGWKLRAAWSIATLRDALGASPEVLALLDGAWDSTQRKLFHLLGGASEDAAPEKRSAAVRLKGALLEGNGTGQTQRSFDMEVDFGRRQVELMTRGALAEDVTLLGLTGILEEIRSTTEALARGIGRKPGEKRTAPRSERIRAAVSRCVSDFNGIHDDLAWVIAHTPAGPARSRLEQLLAPFQSLLSRYPAPANRSDAGTGDATPETDEAPAASPPPTSPPPT